LSSIIANRLKNQTSTLVNSFSRRADRLKDRFEFKTLFKRLSGEDWLETARSFFNTEEGIAVGIDDVIAAGRMKETKPPKPGEEGGGGEF
jgi:hypothetical protein